VREVNRQSDGQRKFAAHKFCGTAELPPSMAPALCMVHAGHVACAIRMPWAGTLRAKAQTATAENDN